VVKLLDETACSDMVKRFDDVPHRFVGIGFCDSACVNVNHTANASWQLVIHARKEAPARAVRNRHHLVQCQRLKALLAAFSSASIVSSHG
jgi:hypothetical protein